MTTRTLFSPKIHAAIAAAGTALCGPVAQAQEADYGFKFFAGASYVEPLSDSQIEGESIDASSEIGIELGGEWRFSDRLGFEVAYLDAQHDVEADGTAVGEIDLKPLNFTLNIYVLDGESFDWYVGPTVSYIDWSDLSFQGGGNIDIESETTWGVSTGIIIGFGDSFGLELGLRYIDASVESPALADTVDVDPLFARAGVSFRF